VQKRQCLRQMCRSNRIRSYQWIKTMWILPKNYPLSSAFAQDMVASKEDLTLLESSIESSLMWRSKPSPLRTWSQRWNRVSWFQRLSSRILKPSQRTSFETALTLLLEDTRASRFQQQGSALAPKTPRHLWPYILDHINAIRPVRCLFENVEGHISLGLREVIGDLEGAGYNATWGIFSASEVGAPHQRKRVYIMANSISAGVWDNDRPPANEGRSAAQFGRADVRQGDREDRSVRPESAGSSSADMADAKSQRYGARREKRDIYQENGRQNWECVPEPAIASTRSGGEAQPLANILGHSQNNRCAGWREPIKRERSENHIKRPDQDLRWQTQRSSQTLANTGSKGLQGQERCWTAGEEGESFGHFTKRGGELSNPNGRGQEQSWPPEPGLGRVVDGCADRVDRLRLLGNGVVPQTAAKAWEILWD
jgi:DNA (cytosine-5)-methyltransferase 1